MWDGVCLGHHISVGRLQNSARVSALARLMIPEAGEFLTSRQYALTS